MRTVFLANVHSSHHIYQISIKKKTMGTNIFINCAKISRTATGRLQTEPMETGRHTGPVTS